MLESRQLRYFIAVAEQLHFTRAADVLNVAQSALSTQIRQLEEDLGVVLINRKKRAAVTLTDAGRMFLAEARLAMLHVDRAEKTGRLSARGQIGRVDLGCIGSAAISGLLGETLRNFRGAHPQVDVNLLPLGTPAQIGALVDGTLDIGLIRPRPAYPDEVETRVIHAEPFCLAMAADDPLAGNCVVRPEDLSGREFIAPQFDEEAGFAETLALLGAAAGVAIVPRIKVADFISALGLAAAGYGLVLLPRSYERMGIPGVRTTLIDGFVEAAAMVLAWRKQGLSPAAKLLVSAFPPALRR